MGNANSVTVRRKSLLLILAMVLTVASAAFVFASVPVSHAAQNEPSVGEQTGSGTMRLKLIVLDPDEHGGTEDSTNSDTTGDGIGDNLSFTIPSAITYVVKANGEMVGPTTARIENQSVYPIHVSSMRMTVNSGFNVVTDATNTNASDAFNLEIGTGTDMLDAVNYQTQMAVGDVSQWVMSAVGSGTGSGLTLSTSGHVSHLTHDITSVTEFAVTHWYLRAGETEP